MAWGWRLGNRDVGVSASGIATGKRRRRGWLYAVCAVTWGLLGFAGYQCFGPQDVPARTSRLRLAFSVGLSLQVPKRSVFRGKLLALVGFHLPRGAATHTEVVAFVLTIRYSAGQRFDWLDPHHP